MADPRSNKSMCVPCRRAACSALLDLCLGEAALSRFAGRLILVFGLLTAALPTILEAGDSVGFVILSSNTSISGISVKIGQTILSGDKLSVEEGAAEIALGHGSRIILSPHTSASLERDKAGVTAVLDRGGITLEQSPQEGLVTRIRSGNVLVAPKTGMATRTQVFMSARELTIGTRQGGLMVDRGGEEFTVKQDSAVRFVPLEDGGGQGGSGGGGAPPPGQGPGGRQWGPIFICALAGGVIGSIPVIVNEASVSSDPGWRWGLIPAGAAAGGLMCNFLAEAPAPKEPPKPDLKNGKKIFFGDKNDLDCCNCEMCHKPDQTSRTIPSFVDPKYCDPKNPDYKPDADLARSIR